MNSKACLVAVLGALLASRSLLAVEPSKLSGKVLFLAAASTTDAISEIQKEFARLHPGVTVRTSFAASSTLAQQVNAGAAADLFLSASSQWADDVEEKGHADKRRDLLSNYLVVVVPVDSRIKLEIPSDLTRPGIKHLALADPTAVPAGIYARQALEKLDLWKALKKRVAGAADVRQTLKFVETGAAEAGIVYSTDAASSTKVRKALTLDPELSRPIRYPLVLLKSGARNPAAVAYYEFLASPVAADVFERFGFIVLVESKQTESQGASPCGR